MEKSSEYYSSTVHNNIIIMLKIIKSNRCAKMGPFSWATAVSLHFETEGKGPNKPGALNIWVLRI